MSQTKRITLSPQILSDLEPVIAETHENVEAIVNSAMAEYLRLWKKRKLREQLAKQNLAKQYEELAAMWNELAEDVADEKWLPVENEALSKFEKALD